MARRGRQSDLDVERLQITLATEELVHLDRIVRIGRFGRNRNDVAARIVAEWMRLHLRDEYDAYLSRRDSGKKFDEQTLGEGAT